MCAILALLLLLLLLLLFIMIKFFSMIRLVSTAGLQKKGQLFEKDIELVLSGVENTKECMTHSPLEVSPIRAGAKLEGGQIFQ